MEVVCIKSKFLRNLFDQNTYVLKQGGDALIVDAGAELEDVKAALAGVTPKAILMTHLHFDHIWNIEKYLAEFGCDVYVCKGAEKKFSDYSLNGSTMLNSKITRNVDAKHIKYYENELRFENFDIEVFFTPGHCKDAVCLKIDNALFCGDTLFANGIGRTDLIDSDNKQMIESLKKISSIDFEVAYSGHYDSFSKNRALDVIAYYV